MLSQNNIYELQTISVKEGLPNSNTFNIVQDGDNFIWISIPGSLLRYDGYNFKSYDASFFNIIESSTLSLGIDHNNLIWFCEDLPYIRSPKSGVFNPRTEQIISFEDFSSGLISAQDVAYINASEYKKGVIFLTTKKGVVYKYDGDFEEIYRFKAERKFRIYSEMDTSGNYWISYDNAELIKINRLKQIVRQYHVNARSLIIDKIFVNENQVIFKGYDQFLVNEYWQIVNDELVLYNPERGSDFQLISLSPAETYYVDNDSLFKTNSSLDAEKTNPTFIANASGRRYHDYLIDRQGVVWLTSNNGIQKLISKANPFTIYQKNNSLRAVKVIDDELWIGGYSRNVIHSFKKNQAGLISLNERTITGIIKDKKSHIWVGTNVNRVFKLDTNGNILNSYGTNGIDALLLPYENPETGKIWVGGSSGLSYFSSNDELINYTDSKELENAYIRQFLRTEEGLWVVSNKGLFLIDPFTDLIIKHYTATDGLPSDNINHIYKDSQGIFWLATKFKGLIKWDISNHTFDQFTTQDGLSNNTIYAVYEDDFNNLWLPSNYGLMRFDKVSNDTQVFTVQDGIADNEFNTFSHFKDANGILYFGGINGLTAFNPQDFIDQSSSAIPISLSDIKVLRKNESDFKNLSLHPDFTDPILLEHDDQILRFEVNLLDYRYLGGHQYAYKIEGFHNNWIYTRDHKISIYNFPYGNHTIKVRAKGDRDLWSKNDLEIPIRVEKPFYLKWQYIFLTGLGLLSIFTWYYWRRIKKLSAAKLVLEHEVQSRTRQIESDKKVIELQAEELKALDEAKGLFFSNLTHEFRTPLTLIIGPLEQIINEPPPANLLKQRVSNILKNAKHILGLINQLLDLSKLESKQMSIAYINADIIAYTKELLQRFNSLTQQYDQDFSFTSNTSSWNTNFDMDKWDKIIYNLVSNAIKFTPEGGAVEITLNKSNDGTGDYIELLVKDTGIGLTKDNKDQIFNRFYQADLSSTRANEGTGIGLSLVKELIELQKGIISIESEKDQGSTFRIMIPVPNMSTVNPQMINPQNEYLVPVLDTAPTKTILSSDSDKKIDLLLVEDNEDIRDYITDCLGDELYHISTARNGEEGLQKALTNIPDLIITDVMMPVKNGFELVRDLRNQMSTSHIPIILLTAKTSIESKLEGLQRGADSYLTKPFNPKELQLQVQNLIYSRKRLQERYAQNEKNDEEIYQQEDVFIRKLKEFINDNLSRSDLNGDVIGAHFGLSRIHLYRKLKALTDVSISEFVKNIRLEKGFELVKEGRLNVSEIAYEVGFTSPSHFSRSFKERYGKSPSQL
jgi:signal transduction histidine kinase/DNA-binding response OmpR family regulator/ligand-binding sensor domain-containing protein